MTESTGGRAMVFHVGRIAFAFSINYPEGTEFVAVYAFFLDRLKTFCRPDVSQVRHGVSYVPPYPLLLVPPTILRLSLHVQPVSDAVLHRDIVNLLRALCRRPLLLRGLTGAAGFPAVGPHVVGIDVALPLAGPEGAELVAVRAGVRVGGNRNGSVGAFLEIAQFSGRQRPIPPAVVVLLLVGRLLVRAHHAGAGAGHLDRVAAGRAVSRVGQRLAVVRLVVAPFLVHRGFHFVFVVK
mmetsp:Transcript_6421/g.13878  ORF Transcript_6421/g.13878 Transcript_6421/m.13878 type:complete len:238 (+) Transcript_6421:88-801(+)